MSKKRRNICMEQLFLNTQNQTIQVWYQNISGKANNPKISSVDNIANLLEKTIQAENWISILFSLESSKGMLGMEEYWQAGLDKFHTSVVYLEGIGLYYFRAGKHHKALKYLKKVSEKEYSTLAIKVSISSAYALAQYHLVLDYYGNLKKNDSDSLEDELISQVATSALYQGNFSQSEELFTVLGERKGIKKLPNLEEALLTNFGDEESLQKFGKSMEEKSKSAENRKGVSLQDWIHFASLLMHHERYQDAVDILTTVKDEKSYTIQ